MFNGNVPHVQASRRQEQPRSNRRCCDVASTPFLPPFLRPLRPLSPAVAAAQWAQNAAISLQTNRIAERSKLIPNRGTAQQIGSKSMQNAAYSYSNSAIALAL